MVRDWRKNIDPSLREYLESQIKGTFSYKKAYELADNKGNAQLWVAVAGLSKQLFNIHMKMNYIEGLMKDVNKRIDELQKGKGKKEAIEFIEAPAVASAVDELMNEPLVSEAAKKTVIKKKIGAKKPAVKKVVKKSLFGKKVREKTEVKKAVIKKPAVKKKISKVKKLKKSLKRF